MLYSSSCWTCHVDFSSRIYYADFRGGKQERNKINGFVRVCTRTKGARVRPTSGVCAHPPTGEGTETQEKLCWKCRTVVVVVAPATRSSCWACHCLENSMPTFEVESRKHIFKKRARSTCMYAYKVCKG